MANKKAIKKGFDVLMMKGEGLPDDGVEILRNPTVKDSRKLAESAPDNQLRFMEDEDGNRYLWKAYDAEHMAVDDFLSKTDPEYSGMHSQDLLSYDKGKFYSDYNSEHLLEESEQLGIPFEEVRKDFMSRYGLPVVAGALGGATFMSPDEAEASPKKLLEALKRADPERIQRAADAGFDVDNIFLRGDRFPEEIDNQMFYHFTEHPEVADLYSEGYHLGRIPGEIETPAVTPVFMKKGAKEFDFDLIPEFQKDASSASRYASENSDGGSYVLKNVYDDFPIANFYDPNIVLEDVIDYVKQDQYVAKRGDVKSIFNDFTPESIANNKLAAAGAFPLASFIPDKAEASTGNIEDDYSQLLAAAQGIGQLGTLGFSDEIMGSIGALYAKLMRPDLFEDDGLPDMYVAGRDIARENLDEAAEQHPYTYYGSQIVPALAMPALGGATLKQMAGLGAAYGLGESDADNLQDLAIDSTIGAGLGLAGPVAVKAKNPLSIMALGLMGADAKK